MSITRFISNGVSAKRTAGGKNSAIEGPTNTVPLSPSVARGRNELRALSSSAISRIGAQLHAAKERVTYRSNTTKGEAYARPILAAILTAGG
jgi:hypothetical protein